MTTDKIRNTIINNCLIEKGEHIVLGLSGGPDSVCLFYSLYQLRSEFDITLHAVHINHLIRPGAAEEDQDYVEKLCLRLGVPCHAFTYDVSKIAKENGTSSEETGRQLRYQSFFRVADSIKEETNVNVKIAVAHNLNDQAETLMMRIMRGTGTDGLSGIDYKRQDRSGAVIIRPLLDVSREEIEAYCEENDLNPRRDLTNLQPIYTRNKIRLELLPYIEKNFNENIIGALSRLSKIAKEDKDYLYQKVDEIITHHAFFEQSNDGGRIAVIPVDVLQAQHSAIRHRTIIKLFESIGLSKDINAVHLEQADKLLLEKKTSALTDFSGGYAMRISYDLAEFFKKNEECKKNIEHIINLDGITEIPELNGQARVYTISKNEWKSNENERKVRKGLRSLNPDDIKEKNECSYSCVVSCDSIKKSGCELVLRTRRQGDYIRPIGMKGTKKIQDFFVDEKIRKEDRDKIPLLCLGSEVVWVVGSRINDNYKIEEETECIILLEYSHII